MPSWGIHMAVAGDMYKILQPSDKNSFLFGNILPDLLCGYVVTDISKALKYHVTHYSEYIPGNTKPAFPHYEIFLEKYRDSMDSMALGYYIHLMTDFHWNTYATKRLKGLDPTKYSQGENLTLNRMKQLDFNRFDKLLAGTYDVPVYTDKLYKDAARLLPVTPDDCRKGVGKLNEISSAHTPPTRKSYIFSDDELYKLCRNTAEDLLKFT
ncbi:MAG: hypothetical protein LIO69_04250 [Oscillospiraceae bacterium]|nr:hypothetical protein [Oscillospiraceae bacterium]